MKRDQEKSNPIQNLREKVETKDQLNSPPPDFIEDGIEELYGHDMSDVKVHYNSSKPSQLSNDAFDQGKQISLSDTDEKHLSHEAWHVVQQESRKKK
jgi:hypothetical protein